MSIDQIGSFWEVDFDILKSMEFGDLVGFPSNSRQLDRVYKVDLLKTLLRDCFRGKLRDDQ